jgi:putative nucleotidyltransferase with HDIG domain
MTLQPRTEQPRGEDRNLPLAASVIDNLAARLKPSGLMLALLSPAAQLLHHDVSSGVFFVRYAMPQLQYRHESGDPIRQLVERLGTASSTILTTDAFPGLSIAAFPIVDRRATQAVLVIVGRSPAFGETEDVQRVCSQLALDSQWLVQQAQTLPVYDNDSIVRQARLVLSMLRDQVRLASLESELDSVSGQLANTYEELSLIYQLSAGMKINRRAGDFFKQACQDVMELMSVRGMGCIFKGDKDHVQEPVLFGEMSLPPGRVHELADTLMTILRDKRCPLLVHDLKAHPQLAWLAEHAQQVLAVPLMRQEQVLGCIFGIDKVGGVFDSVDSKLLNSIANESAIYLENVMLFDDARGLMMGLLHSLTSAVDAKDAYTCGHSERVALFARELARAAKLPDAITERVYMAGLLHDVGKIGVPESVLQKAGRLSEEEFAQMKKHPEIGARILRDIRQIEDIIPGVMSHHEKFDGKGYPHGLAGENIPLFGRIICLADSFDAMTSNRTYRKAMALSEALEEIRRCSGTHFDPVLAKAFVELGAPRLEELVHNHQEQSTKILELQQLLRSA